MEFVNNKVEKLDRRGFIKYGAIGASVMALGTKNLLAQTCDDLSTTDVFGPYPPLEGTPERTVLGPVGPDDIPMTLTGKVLANDCETPIPGVKLSVWHCNSLGEYAHPNDCTTCPAHEYYGILYTNEDGEYTIETLKPVPYRSRPAHFHFHVEHEGEELVTQMYMAGDPNIDTDRSSSDPGAANRIVEWNDSSSGTTADWNIHFDMEYEALNTEDRRQFEGAAHLQVLNMGNGILFKSPLPSSYVRGLEIHGLDGRLMHKASFYTLPYKWKPRKSHAGNFIAVLKTRQGDITKQFSL